MKTLRLTMVALAAVLLLAACGPKATPTPIYIVVTATPGEETATPVVPVEPTAAPTFSTEPTTCAVPDFPIPGISDTDYVNGDPGAPITVYEYSDFQ